MGKVGPDERTPETLPLPPHRLCPQSSQALEGREVLPGGEEVGGQLDH